jgi:hypothetical protein
MDVVFINVRGPPNVNIESIAIKNNQAKVTFYVVQSESEKPNESLNKLGTGEFETTTEPILHTLTASNPSGTSLSQTLVLYFFLASLSGGYIFSFL